MHTPPTLYRLLRALASVGVFTEVEEQQFALTPLAELWRSDVPASMRLMPLAQQDVGSNAHVVAVDPESGHVYLPIASLGGRPILREVFLGATR